MRICIVLKTEVKERFRRNPKWDRDRMKKELKRNWKEMKWKELKKSLREKGNKSLNRKGIYVKVQL